MKAISSKDFINIIKGIHETSHVADRRFCFILGAGASRNSNIPTGFELARRWFEEIKERMSFHGFNLWVRENEIDENNLGSKYGEIYLTRFENDKQSAFDFLYEAMRDASPSIGYAILAQILANTKNNVVITTNFDSLVEGSLYYYSSKKPLVCGHESLSNYARPSSDRPLIIKVHRDLFYNPFSEPNQINVISDSWRRPLRRVLDQYIPIVIGYAGNDGSLMNYLTEAELPDKFFWCYRRDSEPDKKVKELLSLHEDACLVEIDGFDEVMYELMQIFELDLLEGIIKKRFEIDINKLTIQYTEISKRLGHAKTIAANSDMVEHFLQDTNPAPSVYIYLTALVSKNIDKLPFINQALGRFPNEPLLLTLKAQELLSQNEFEKAEEVYKLAFDYGRDYPIVINNYANFLEEYKKDFAVA